jgi:hypothetical protein
MNTANTERTTATTYNVDTRNEKARLVSTIARFFGVPERLSSENVSGVWVGSIMQEMSECGMMIAGGTITSIFSGGKVNDLDFYCYNVEDHKKAEAFLKKHFPTSCMVTRNAVTLKRRSDKSNHIYTVQLITRFTGLPYEVMNWFDFTITQGAYCFTENDFFFGERFFADLAKKKLVYLGSSMYPICAMYRTKKYQARGFTTPGSTIMHIALSIIRLEIKTYRDLKDQLMGIDTMYLQGLLAGPGYQDDIPVDYGVFIKEAFEALNGFSEEDQREEAEGL